MAAPGGVGSGSASESAAPELETPEAVTPEAVTTEDLAAEPEPSEPTLDNDTEIELDAEHQPAAQKPAGERRRGGWLVVAGVIFVLIAVAAAAVVLVVATHGFRHKTLVTYSRPPAVFGLRAGQCLDSSQNGLSVTVLSCATPHEAEVFATFSLTGSSWPGSSAVRQQANSGCADRIASYLNPQLLNAGLTQQYIYPDQSAWKAGVRTVVCEVSSDSGPLSGSVRSSG